MRGMNMREIALICILMVAIGFLAWWNLSSDKPGTAARGPLREPGAAAGSAGQVPVLALNRRNEQPTMDEARMRNLFNYTKSPEEYEQERLEAERAENLRQEAEKRRKEEQERLAKEAEERRKWEVEHPKPPPPPQAPAANFKFLGYLGPPKDKLAVLSVGGPSGDVHIVRKGEVIDGKFKVLEIDFETLTLGFVDPKFSDQKRTFRMGG